ncbi:trehalose transport-related protein [Naematelia encephala]|uniref:Trehalose transport-related protein n=1 Tax=Naematelia encephala TaxID=71784 RepID=A0A1Y2BAG4_9TREE|nr:trehalose transport-related protein [Naematelia encephala]
MVGIKFKDTGDHSVGLTEAQLNAVIDIDPELVRLGYDVVGRQKKESFRQAWRNHWRAACWSIFLTSALFMEGYDTAVINSFFGLPAFLNSFGIKVGTKLTIPANYQSGLTNIAYVGQCIGLIINGWCQERFGSRKAFIGGMIVMTATIFLAVFAVSLNMLLVAELAMGIPWGMFQTLSTAYAAEICPIQLRGYLNAFASVGYGGGSFISSGVLKACSTLTGSMGWKIPYMLQWVWPVPLATGCFFAPESAWWLARKGRFEDAERTITRCAKPGFYAEREAAGFVAFMQHTDALEKVEASQGSWKEIFKGVNLRRTEIMLGVWGVQLWNGNIITGLTVELLENAGMSVTGAFDMNLVLSAMAIIGVMISWFALSRFGRRSIYLTGILLIGSCLLPIGILGFVDETPSTARAMGGLMVCINLLFHISLGPVCYSIVGELPSSRLRSRSIVLGRFFYLVSAIIGTQLRARMTSVDSWNWERPLLILAKSALFWFGCNLTCLIWTFFRLPETGGFSFAELDILFANKVPTRRFKQFKIRGELAFYIFVIY